MIDLKELLSDEEIRFIFRVIKNPGGRVENAFSDVTGNSLWIRPEKLEIIECVGSYKWKPTDKLHIETKLFVPKSEGGS